MVAKLEKLRHAMEYLHWPLLEQRSCASNPTPSTSRIYHGVSTRQLCYPVDMIRLVKHGILNLALYQEAGKQKDLCNVSAGILLVSWHHLFCPHLRQRDTKRILSCRCTCVLLWNV